MTNIRLHIAYDGTNYAGWQKQIAGHGKTVQGELERALSRVLREKIAVIGAGRTDSGVHAREQVANFYTDRAIPAENIGKALLKDLPEDIVVWQAETVSDDFHARFSPHVKTYAYNFLASGPYLPWNRRYNYLVRKQPDWAVAAKAAGLLAGEHNFKAFAATGSSAKTYERTITACKLIKPEPQPNLQPWQETGETYVLEVSGTGFLYKMVRLLAGSVLWAGLGKIGLEDIGQALAEPGGTLAPALPARGLFLKSIVYEEKW